MPVTLPQVHDDSTRMESLTSLFVRFRARGDLAALGEVFDRTAPRLLSLALHLCGQPADAEDALQATFVVAMQKAAAFDATQPLEPWLAGILAGEAKNLGRRAGRRHAVELPEVASGDADPAAASERRELVQHLRTHIDALPEEQRQALLLQLQHGLAAAEIAEVLVVPAGTVRMRLHRGLQALRKLLPAGLACWLLSALTGRGLAAVRQTVLARAGTLVGTSVTLGSVLMLKRIVVATVVVLAGLLGWSLWPGTAVGGALPGIGAALPMAAELRSTPAPAPAIAPGSDRTALANALAADAAAALVVHVVREATGAPASHVALQVTFAGRDPTFAARQAVTGQDGVARFTELEAGRVRIALDRGPVASAELEAGATVEQTLVVPTGRTARGRVVDPQGAPVPFAELWVDYQRPTPDGGWAIGQTDAFGEFTLDDLQRGDDRVRYAAVGASHPQFAPSWLVPVPADGAMLTLRLLAAGATVIGHVVDAAGKPVAGAAVRIGRTYGQRAYQDADGTELRGWGPQELRSDAQGCFRACGLAAGEIELVVRARGFVAHTEHVATAAGASHAVEVRLRSGAAVQGHVRDPAGQPVADADVWCESYGRHERAHVQTAADGSFTLPAVNPARIELRVRAEGFRHVSVSRTAEPSAVVVWDATLQRLATLRGVLRDERGSPLVGWGVASATLGKFEASGADGAFQVDEHDGLPLELWLARPGQAAFRCDWLALPVDRVFEVVVPDAAIPAGVLCARVISSEGTPWTGYASLSARGRSPVGSAVHEGELLLEQIAAGDYQLILSDGHGQATVPLAVAVLSPGTLDLGEIRLPATGRLVVHCARQDGTPLQEPYLFLEGRTANERSVPLDGSASAAVAIPAGEYHYVMMAENARWSRGTVNVLPDTATRLEIAAEPATRRALCFPAPLPEHWGTSARASYVLRDPAGEVYDQGEFDARQELPYQYMPTLYPGDWMLELLTDQGKRFSGSFRVADLSATFAPIVIRVQQRQ